MPLTCRKNVPLENFKVGDYAWVKYTATTSGSVGYFSDFGTKNDTEASSAGLITVSGTATPNGYFKAICVGKDAQGKLKFIADRNLQSTISWDKLNEVGFGNLSGVELANIREGVVNKLENPAILPTVQGQGCSFSSDNQYLSVVQPTSPFITIYKRSGDTFTKLPNPATLPTDTGNACAFSPDNTYLSVAHSTSPFIIIYKRSGDTFTKLPDPETLPTSIAYACAFSPDNQYLSVGHLISPFITIYKRTGDTFTKLPDPTTLPASTGYGCAFSLNNQYLSVSHDVSPFITIYKRNGDTFEKLPNPATLPTGMGRSCAFSSDNTYLSVAHFTTPFITIYKRSGDTFTKLPNPATLPAGQGYGCAFSPNSIYLYIGHMTTPFITIYERSGDTFTKLPNPTPLPSGGVLGCSTSPDSTFISLAHQNTPFLTIYKSPTIFPNQSPIPKTITRMITGGISATDLANEWDRHIVSSTLNNNITAGDNASWNWSSRYSWTTNCSTATPAHRISRGSTVSGFTSAGSTISNTTYHFRPVFMFEIPSFTKYLFQSGLNIKRYNGILWETVGVSPATPEMFEEYGMTEKPTDEQIESLGSCKILEYTTEAPSTTPTISGTSVAVPSKTFKSIEMSDKKFYEKCDLTNEVIEPTDQLKVTVTDFDYSVTENIVFPPPTTPQNLAFETNGYNISYTWEETDTANYRLYSGENLIAETTDTHYTEIRTTESSKDVFVVSVAPIVGQSNPSNVITATTIPNVPTSLSISQISTGFILTWNENSSINVGHKIYKRINGGAWSLLATVADVSTYTDTFVYSSGTLYEYQVCSYNAVGESSFVTWGIESVDSVVLNAVLDDVNSTIIYSWDSVSGADSYILYLNTNGTGSEVTVTESPYNYVFTGETVQTAYVVARNDYAYGSVSSSNSNTTNITSSPRVNVSDIACENTLVGENYNIHISWTDQSTVENSFKIAYKIDANEWQYVNVATGSKSFVGSLYSYDLIIPYTNVQDAVHIKIATFNTAGTTVFSNPITLVKAPTTAQGYYDEANSLAKIAWKDESLLENKYRLFYSIDGGGQFEVDIETEIGVNGSIFTRNIAMNSSSEMNVFIIPVIGTVLGLPSPSFKVGLAYNTLLSIPTFFTGGWASDGVAQYTWTDNTLGELGYEVSYTLNGVQQTIIDVPSVSSGTMGHEYGITIAMTNLDSVNAIVRTYDIFGRFSDWSNPIELTYYDFVPVAPSNYRRERTPNGVRLSWEPVDYVNYYQITYAINGETFVSDTANTYLDVEIDYTTVTSFSAYMKAYYNGGKESPLSPTIVFTPVYMLNDQMTIVYTHTSTEYSNDQLRINKDVMAYNTLSTATTTYNTMSEIPFFYTKTISYQTFRSIFLEEKIIHLAKKENPLSGLISNSTLKDFSIEQRSYTAGLSKDFPTCVVSFQASQLGHSVSPTMIIKNNNVMKDAQISSWIKQVGIRAFETPVVTTSYLKARQEIEPIHYTIYTKYHLSVPIETEIHKIRVCTMGDSITAGHPGYWAESKTGDITSQYQYWLQKRLKDEFEVQNNGYGSDTTLRCLNRFDRDIISQHPQYCIIQAGTNDIHWALAQRKDDQEYLDQMMDVAKNNTIAMVDKCVAHNIIPIIGTLIPRTSATGIYRKALLDFNTWIINYCNGRDDCYFADFYNAGKQNIPPTPLEEPSVIGNMNPLYDGDSRFDQYGNLIRRGQGVHPSAFGYKLMAEAIPLSLFKSLASGIALYLDEKCTIEEESHVSSDTSKSYHINFRNMNRGKKRVTSRYIKNTGTSTVIYSLIAKKESGLDIKFSVNNTTFTDRIDGSLAPNAVVQLFMQVDIPQFGDVPELALNIATRSMKTK